MTKTLYIVLLSLFIGISYASAQSISVNGMNNCIGNEYSSIGDAYPNSGNVFLVLELEIVNNGYESFSVDPGYFKLSTPNFNYKSSPVTYYLDKIGKRTLPSGSIPDGGRISGFIAYEVPSGTSNYNVRYDGWEDVNIQYNCK